MADDSYDVFVSYSRADGRHAADIDSVLRDKGLKTYFDRRNLEAGLPWVRALERAIGAAKALIVLIGPRGLGNTQQYERELAFVRQTRDPVFPVVPVILPETTTDPPFDFLRVLTWIDFSHVTRVFDAPDVLEQLLRAIHGQPTSAESARDAICPYRGLDAFREEDSAFFFGRGSADDPKSSIGQLVRQVREHSARKVGEPSFVMVVGRSGSGKSSLVYAGLLPALRREHDRVWNVLTLRPGPEPLRALAAAFNPRAGDEGTAEYIKRITKETNELRTGDVELLSHMIGEELGRAEGQPDRLLLYIDQWEELYAQAPSSSDKERTARHAADVNHFIDLLLHATRSGPVTVVASVRADFYDPLISHQSIQSLLPARQVTLGAMPRSDLERTIIEPARKVGLTFDPPSLVQRILDEAGEGEGMLPLLQYALKETWALRKGNAMTGDSYTRSGGVREAIRITAERTFGALSPEDQQAARQLFLRLVTPGEGQEDTRACAAMPVEQAQRKIVDQFAGPRTRLLVTGSDRAQRPTVEVAHEALIRTWPRLRSWVDANREKLRARTAVLQAKAEWEQQGRREDLLLPAGFQLERARALLAEPGDISTDEIKEFISRSSAREDKAKARERRVQAVIYALLVGIIIGLIGVIKQAYVVEQWNWFWTMRPYRYEQVRPYVLSESAERALKPGDTFRECNKDCPEMIVVPAGKFMMGSPVDEKGRTTHEGPQHLVTIARPFAVSIFDVTFADWDACTWVGGCRREGRAHDAGWGRETRPVIYVSWDDAQDYVKWLSEMTGKKYRLLSEAEWEYAARAGTRTAFYWGDEIGMNNANCYRCGSQWDYQQTSPVGWFKPNEFGLHDMAGNVWQWVQDCWNEDYSGAPIDGTPWVESDCKRRVVRGGSWGYFPVDPRSAYRYGDLQVDRNYNLGFRVARTLAP